MRFVHLSCVLLLRPRAACLVVTPAGPGAGAGVFWCICLLRTGESDCFGTKPRSTNTIARTQETNGFDQKTLMPLRAAGGGGNCQRSTADHGSVLAAGAIGRGCTWRRACRHAHGHARRWYADGHGDSCRWQHVCQTI